MTTYTVLPDLDALLTSFLDGHADLIPLHGGRVGTDLAAGTNTSIRLVNIGGTMPWPWFYRAEFQVECWGGTEIEALTLARTVCAVIWEMSATYGNVLTSVVTIAPFAGPDPVSNRARYIVQVQIEATP